MMEEGLPAPASLSLLSQVTRDFATFSQHAVDLVLLCELHENHHNRATLPPNWQRIGADEFQLAMAPGWTIHDYGLTKGWRLYFQAGGSSSRQQQAAGGSSSRRQHHQ